MKKFVLLIGLCLFIFTCSKGDDNTPVVPQKFTVSVSASDGGSVSTSGGEYNENTSVSITATPQQGYEFSGWSGTTLTGSSINVKVTSNQTINANFTRSIYTLTIGSVGVGEVTQQLINSGRGEDYESGKTIRLTATPASEFLFYNWEQLNNNLSEYTYENPLEVIMDSSKTVTATFEERLPIVNPDNTDKNNTVGKWKIRKNRPGSQRLLSARAVDCKVNEIIFRSDNSFTIITETSTITGQYTIDSETSISLNQGGTTIGRLSDIILTESFISFNIELTDVCDEQLDADKDPTYNESEDPIAPSNTGSQTTETGSSTLVSGPCTIETEITSDNANQTISLGDPIQDIIIDITVGSTCTETLSVSSSNLPEGVTVSLDNNQITVAGTPISNSNGTQITFDYDIMLNVASPTSIISGTIRVENDTSTETNPNQGGGGTDNSDSLGNSIDINSDLNIGTPNDPIYFENGVCKCPGTPVGESYNLAGTLYTVVDDKTIIDQITNENYNLCTTSVSTFFALFEENTSFDSYVGFWDTSNVLDMNRLFNGATQFNQSLSRWNTSKVKYMPNVFSDTETFNQDISNWDTSNVERMDQMFARAKFNQDIGSWEVGNVTLMDNMFDGATQFNQDLSDWCVNQILNEPENFTNEDSVLSEENKPIWGTCPSD
ncbi:MAG: BspA family leucine-rich repeat surface protein [Flavobacteriaceae bacterium]|nr:BspA family leucine-rich repeat surface protein [Flavobacteriaceae bacterium]MDG1941692.1 BspA family leucine-rich repeat surface protein [Flavobacteriaceae bacterium]